MYELVKERIQESIRVKQGLLENEELLERVSCLADEIVSCIRNGGKLILCGNGGSASDALHFAGEIVGRFQRERNAWPAVVLNADVATMTAIANDYSYDEVFSRQAEAHVTDKDILIGISTSGNSKNVMNAIEAAKRKGAKTAALLGKDGGKIAPEVDYALVVPCNVTARVQESHICLIHILCEISESILAS
ncbi:MAG: SIS domain-containing protein [Synergistaceae bacterium]|nr:SIS domain-containing protein [Synergistaceae bacterium]MBQ3450030.1 SIS domain-containing protein [Synergistaceae bacterium]MBQ3693243.1 SIS domain-containing protein [Synergistaceae bacterium]MBQ6110964.1 SIS domain-containing protein [Synergistaceae bacterium]MBQ9627796.1 SIS domain-containing protein [Synergistaceae bacterium]